MTKFFPIFFFLLLTSCSEVPAIAKSVESIATDDAIVLKVDRDAIKKDTDVHILIDVVNKSPNQ
jgi:hypothetical protein